MNDSLIDTDTGRPYWEGLAEGELRYQRCGSCGHAWLPPREFCPECLGGESEWVAACGRGKLVSWVIFHVAYNTLVEDRVPYNVAIVELDEGPRMITNIVDCEADGLTIDAPVSLVLQKEDQFTLARFSQVRTSDATAGDAGAFGRPGSLCARDGDAN